MTVRREPRHATAPPPIRRAPYDSRDAIVLGGALAVAAVLALAAQLAGMARLQPLVGLILILSIAYSLSTNRKAIRADDRLGLRPAAPVRAHRAEDRGRPARFEILGDRIRQLLDFASVGSCFVFGPLGDKAVWPRIMNRSSGPKARSTASSSRFRSRRRSSSSPRCSRSSITSASCSSSCGCSRS